VLQLLPCPHCRQQSLLPQETSLEATLRCPSCGQELVLGEALVQQFGSWEVVDDPTAHALHSSAQGLSQPLVVPVPPSDETNQDGELNLADEATPTSTQTSTVSVRPYTHFEYERMKRKQKSPIWSVIPVVLGGLAAFPVALLILWYGFGKDVGEMGPKVAQYAPWIVPKQFHPVSNSQPPKFQRKQQPRLGESGLPQLSENMPKPTLAAELPEADTNETSLVPLKPANEETSIGSTADDQPMSTEDNKSTETPKDNSNEDKNIFESIRQINGKLVELIESIKSKSTSSDEQKDRFFAYYDQLADIAVALAEIDSNNPQRRLVDQEMSAIAKTVKQNEFYQTAFDKTSALKASEPPGDGRGIAMILEVKESEPLRDLWLVAGNHKLVKKTVIEIPRSLMPALNPGQRLFVLGVLSQAESEAYPLLRVTYSSWLKPDE
jgi:hypothetical protein